ncbi:reverse transcriptase domain-containing protein [Tanacetum coccineum]|uniref:Reverse transcriptase domain-containing protein n=1 Tax=Tanacetum coccineum TaxID=301880 RepID=A0ABQ5EV24_9ASTR
MDSQIISLNEELQDIRNKYNELREGNASKNHLNDDTPMCERHEANYIQSEELNNDVRNDLEDFKRCIHSMRTVHWKLFARDDGKTTGVLPKKKSKPINQEPQSKTDFEKLMTKFLDDQRVSNMFVKNNVNDMILKMKQNEKNFQTIFKNMERKIDEWEKSQNISSEQTNWTEPQPPPQAQTEQVNVVFTGSGKSDDHPKIQKDPPPSIIVNNKIKKDRPIRTSKRDNQVVKTNEYPFHLFHIPNITIDQVMLRAFPMSLTGAASRRLRNKPTGSITTWEDLKTKFLSNYCPPARTAKKMEEINNFQQEPDENLYQAWERFKELLMKCPQHYLTEMQEVVLFYKGLDVPT